MLPTVKIAGCIAQNARITASMRLVSSRWFSCGVAMSNGGSWKTCPFRMCPSRLSCRFAWQAWRFVTFQTCLIMFWKCQNWRKSRTKCCFFCIHVSCFESLVFLWRRCVYGGSWKTCPFRMCPSRLSCRFAWQAWHFVTFQTCLIMCWKCQNWRKPRTKCWFFCIHMSYLESLTLLSSTYVWAFGFVGFILFNVSQALHNIILQFLISQRWEDLRAPKPRGQWVPSWVPGWHDGKHNRTHDGGRHNGSRTSTSGGPFHQG